MGRGLDLVLGMWFFNATAIYGCGLGILFFTPVILGAGPVLLPDSKWAPRLKVGAF